MDPYSRRLVLRGDTFSLRLELASDNARTCSAQQPLDKSTHIVCSVSPKSFSAVFQAPFVLDIWYAYQQDGNAFKA